jgi:AhpD family alkylhydroperoxidase
MRREDIDGEMRKALGTVLVAFDRIPDELAGPEWDLMKRLQLGETLIPGKCKELIGLAIAAASRCHYGIVLHTEGARLHGASDAEIAEAVHYAKLESGWSVHLAGLQVDPDQFALEVARTVAFLAEHGVESI